MKVKIGDVIYDSDAEAVMLILKSEEKSLISNMGDQTMICLFPESCTMDEVRAFMIYPPIERGCSIMDTGDFKLVKGQNISLPLYRGASKIEAESTFNYLQVNKENDTPIPLKGTDFHIRISKIKETSKPGTYKPSRIYSVEVEGVLE